MRFALKVIAVLECARLALVAVHRQIARRRIGPDKAPFPARGKPAPPRPRRPLSRTFPVPSSQFPLSRSAASGHSRLPPVFGEVLIFGDQRMGVACRNSSLDLSGRGVVDMVVAQLQHRRSIAAAHAGRAQNPDARGSSPSSSALSAPAPRPVRRTASRRPGWSGRAAGSRLLSPHRNGRKTLPTS